MNLFDANNKKRSQEFGSQERVLSFVHHVHKVHFIHKIHSSPQRPLSPDSCLLTPSFLHQEDREHEDEQGEGLDNPHCSKAFTKQGRLFAVA